jgi:hypothetical protein
MIDRCEFGQNHTIHARLSSDKSLIQEQVQTSTENNLLSSDPTTGNDGQSTQKTNKTFLTMRKLIRGALTGGVNYVEIYTDTDLAIETNLPITPNNPNEHQNLNTHKIPTLHKTARKVARLEKRKLDEKQYIAYEMIACTFLLGLIQDGNDPNEKIRPWARGLRVMRLKTIGRGWGGHPRWAHPYSS